MWKNVLLSGVILLTAIVSAEASDVVFNNLGPGDTYGITGWWFGRLPTGESYNPVAGDFIPAGSGNFNELWAGMMSWTGQNEVTLALLADNGGSPGVPLWQRTFDNQLTPQLGSLLHVADINGPYLTAGTRYWIQASTPDAAGTAQLWYANNQGDKGLVAVFPEGHPMELWQADRFALKVGVVPEPSTVAMLLAVALGGLLQWNRKR
jgi:hypothetical protein